jgi:hypothetical protein
MPKLSLFAKLCQSYWILPNLCQLTRPQVPG